MSTGDKYHLSTGFRLVNTFLKIFSEKRRWPDSNRLSGGYPLLANLGMVGLEPTLTHHCCIPTVDLGRVELPSDVRFKRRLRDLASLRHWHLDLERPPLITSLH